MAISALVSRAAARCPSAPDFDQAVELGEGGLLAAGGDVVEGFDQGGASLPRFHLFLVLPPDVAADRRQHEQHPGDDELAEPLPVGLHLVAAKLLIDLAVEGFVVDRLQRQEKSPIARRPTPPAQASSPMKAIRRMNEKAEPGICPGRFSTQRRRAKEAFIAPRSLTSWRARFAPRPERPGFGPPRHKRPRRLRSGPRYRHSVSRTGGCARTGRACPR